MTEFLEPLSKIAVLVFVVACMLTAGLGLSIRDVAAPLRRVRLVLCSLLANFVCVPAIAYGLTRLVELDHHHAIGLLLLGGAAGAPFLPKLTELTKGDGAFAVGLMLLLMVVSVVFMPLALPVLIPGLAAEPWPLLKPLLFTMLIPLAIGMYLKQQFPLRSLLLRHITGKVSNLSMLLGVGLLIGLNFQAMLATFGTGAVAVGMGFVAASVGVGAVLGGPTLGTRSVLAVGTGQRNVAAALILATQNFRENPGVVAMLLVTTFGGLVVLLLAARYFAKQTSEIAR